jgi:hypothetical protein
VVHIVTPETVVAWHRRGFRVFWTWKSRHRTGRPAVPHDVRALIRDMSTANPLWGAPRIHGELLKLGIAVSQSTVAVYMRRHPRPPSQTWRIFLPNHASQIMAADPFVVPTITSRLLFILTILSTTADRSFTLRSPIVRQRPGRHNSFTMPFQRTTPQDIYFTIAIRSLQTAQPRSRGRTRTRFARRRARHGRMPTWSASSVRFGTPP